MTARAEAPYVALQTYLFFHVSTFSSGVYLERVSKDTAWEVKCCARLGGLSGAAGCDLLTRKGNSCLLSVSLKCHGECGSGGREVPGMSPAIPFGLWLKSQVYAVEK